MEAFGQFEAKLASSGPAHGPPAPPIPQPTSPPNQSTSVSPSVPHLAWPSPVCHQVAAAGSSAPGSGPCRPHAATPRSAPVSLVSWLALWPH